MSIGSITSNALKAWVITPATLSAGSTAGAASTDSSSTGTASAATGVSGSLLGSLASDIQAMLVQFQNDATGGASASATGTTAAASAGAMATADASPWQTGQTGSATQGATQHHHHHHGGGGLAELENATEATARTTSTTGTATASSSGTTSLLAQTLASDVEQALQGYAANAASAPMTILTA